VCDSSDGTETLIADLCVRRAWEPQIKALFDIRVVDIDAQSYHDCTPHDVLSTAEGEKIPAGLSGLACLVHSSLCVCGWHAHF